MRAAWVELDDKRWLFDEESWMLADWFVVKNATGLGRVAFLNGVIEEDPTVLQALIWVLRRKDEPNLQLGEVQFRPAALSYSPVDEVADADPPPRGDGAEPPPD